MVATLMKRDCQKMLQSIESSVVEDVDQAVQRSPVFSLTLDESTNIGNKKRLITYVRYIENNKIKTKLFRNSEIVDGRADATVGEQDSKLRLCINLRYE